jgi:Chaperone of endosialidase
MGENALVNNTTGNNNTAIGAAAFFNNDTGSGNIALGLNAGDGISTANNVIAIGTSGANVSNSCYIGQIFGATSSGGTQVFINSDGKLGTLTSSRRWKENIQPMDKASEALLALKPVTFHYKEGIDPAGTSQFGLVAEDVEKVNPDLVVRDKEGKTYSVRYDQVNAMLLNEFLKEHAKVQKLEAALEAVDQRLKEQDAKIEKVSSQIELNRSGLQMAVSNH